MPNIGPITTVSGQGNPSSINTQNYKYSVTLDGTDISKQGWDRYIQTIYIERNFPLDDKAEITFANVSSGYLASAASFFPGKILGIKLGYSGSDLVDVGKFLVTSSSYDFMEGLPGYTLKLSAVSTTYVLAKEGEKQAIYEDKKDSDIAKKIAAYYSLSTDIDDTTPKYDFVVQSGITDLDFLKWRGRLYGNLVYVNDKTLHFHPYRLIDNGATFGIGNPKNKDKGISIGFKVFPYRQFPIQRKAQINMENLKVFDGKSTDKKDKLSQKNPSINTAFSLSSMFGKRSEEFIVGEGHLNTDAEIKRQLDKFQESSGWSIVNVYGKAIGDLSFVPGEIVSINPMDQQRFEGKFLCVSAIHTITSDPYSAQTGFTTEFMLRRSFLGTSEQDLNFIKLALQTLMSISTPLGSFPFGLMNNKNFDNVEFTGNTAIIH